MLTKTKIPKALTVKIIKALQSGVAPWRIPWTGFENTGFPCEVGTGQPFRGVNALLLNLAAMEQGFQSRWWATVEDWTRIGCWVSGKGTKILDDLTVFNAEEVEGLAVDQYLATDRQVSVNYSPAERIIAASGADIRFERGDRALYYYPPLDYIVFPLKIQFIQGQGGLPAYYDSIFHELSHWSEPRLGWRSLPILNELRAEMVGPFMAGQIGIPVLTDMTVLRNHQKYLGQWIEAMKKDPALIVRIAAGASQAVEFLGKR